MKSIINGKTYNTETARAICTLPCSAESRGDFGWHDTTLYQTTKGAFFLAGHGGALSLWARRVRNGSIGGEGVRAVTAQEAREYMEQSDCDEEDYIQAGLPVEEA